MWDEREDEMASVRDGREGSPSRTDSRVWVIRIKPRASGQAVAT